jgi:hypothetical protein
MPPKAITSLVGLLVVDDGVEGLKEVAATRDAASACRTFSLEGNGASGQFLHTAAPRISLAWRKFVGCLRIDDRRRSLLRSW